MIIIRGCHLPPRSIQVHSHPLEQTLTLFFIIITGKVYALSLMHTINSRQAMRERFKSHDHGRTSLSRFQWSEPQTLVELNVLPIPYTLEVRVAFPNQRNKSQLDFRLVAYTQPNTTGMSSGLNQESPQVRRTASGVTSNYKQAISPRTISGGPPLCSVMVNSRPRTADAQEEDTQQHQHVPPEDFRGT
jgi:hypothetical protein